MIKLLHCADIHLDRPFVCGSLQKAETRRLETREAFAEVLRYAENNQADFLLIAGDLFHASYATPDTVSFVRQGFASLTKCKVIIAPGNHDPRTESSIYARTRFSENVFVFERSELQRFRFEDVGDDHEAVDVYGYAFTDKCMSANPFAGRRPDDPTRINLLCGHGDMINAYSDRCCIAKKDVENSGFDYIALGHIHNGGTITQSGHTWYGYSGSLEGRDFGEPGYRGAVFATVTKQMNEAQVEARGVRFSHRRYETERVNVTGATEQDQIRSAVQKMLAEKKYGADTALRVILEGEVAPGLTPSQEELKRMFGMDLFLLEIQDKTLPLFDCAKLEEDPTIRGAYFRRLLPVLRSDDPKEREKAALALRVGLSALSGNDFTNL